MVKEEFDKGIQNIVIDGVKPINVKGRFYGYDCYPKICVCFRQINNVNVIEIHVRGDGMYGVIKVQIFNELKVRLEFYGMKVEINKK